MVLLTNKGVSFIFMGVSVSVFVGYIWSTQKLELFILSIQVSLKDFSWSLACIKSSMRRAHRELSCALNSLRKSILTNNFSFMDNKFVCPWQGGCN